MRRVRCVRCVWREEELADGGRWRVVLKGAARTPGRPAHCTERGLAGASYLETRLESLAS